MVYPLRFPLARCRSLFFLACPFWCLFEVLFRAFLVCSEKNKRKMLRERNVPWYFFFITRKERSFHWLNEHFWYNYHLPAPPELFLDLFLLLPAFLAWFLALFLAALIALFDKYLPTHGQIGAPLAPGRNREEDWTLISPSCCPALNQVLPRCIKSAAMLIAVRM